MSHFMVLVVGDVIEKQLAPYHEYECTGRRDEYVQYVSILDKMKRRYKDNREPGESFEEFICREHSTNKVLRGDVCEHSNYYVVDDGGKVVDVMTLTNPNAKWDYWRPGGYFEAYYLGKSGESIFDGVKSDFDFDALRKKRAEYAAKQYDQAKRLTDGKTWESWASVVDRFTEKYPDTDGTISVEGLDAARKFYNWQEPVKALKAHDDYSWEDDLDVFLQSRDEYIASMKDQAVPTYAYVKDGKWYARGDMWWWGLDRPTCTPGDWYKQFNEMLDSLPDNTRLTIVDCHI